LIQPKQNTAPAIEAEALEEERVSRANPVHSFARSPASTASSLRVRLYHIRPQIATQSMAGI
jgi:hypothetical protein